MYELYFALLSSLKASPVNYACSLFSRCFACFFFTSPLVCTLYMHNKGQSSHCDVATMKRFVWQYQAR